MPPNLARLPDSQVMQDYIALLDSALEQPVGIGVLCHTRDTADELRQALYIARAKAREAGEQKYEQLTLSISPHSSDILFIYHSAALPEDADKRLLQKNTQKDNSHV